MTVRRLVLNNETIISEDQKIDAFLSKAHTKQVPEAKQLLKEMDISVDDLIPMPFPQLAVLEVDIGNGTWMEANIVYQAADIEILYGPEKYKYFPRSLYYFRVNVDCDHYILIQVESITNFDDLSNDLGELKFKLRSSRNLSYRVELMDEIDELELEMKKYVLEQLIS